MSHEYTALVQDDELVDKEAGSLAAAEPPAQVRRNSSRPSLSIAAAIFVAVVLIINVYCVTASWRRVDAVYEALKGRLDFRDPRELPRPNTNTYYGD